MAAYKQFILWQLVERPGEKPTKLPVSPITGGVCNAHDPQNWVTHEEAEKARQLFGSSGVAFVFTESAGFWFLDIDGALQADGNWSPLAHTLCAQLAGAAVEVSQSGKGLHIFGRGVAPAHGCKNEALDIEFYTTGRFVALTGTSALGDAAADLSAQLPSLVAQYFPYDGTTTSAGDEAWSDTAASDWHGPADDDVLLGKMLNARLGVAQVFGGKASFADLFNGNAEVLSACWPDTPPKQWDYSRADGALAQHLAFWTGRNTERIRRLMLRSKLVRDKWDKHRKYLWLTVSTACQRQDTVYNDKRSDKPAPEPMEAAPASVSSVAGLGVRYKVGSQFMTAQQQAEFFAGCVYVTDAHCILTPIGTLKPEAFKVRYGGYDFCVDSNNDKTSKDAWEAFTNNRSIDFPKVDRTCFRPELPSLGVVHEAGLTLVNTYRAITTEARDGDASRFLHHLELMLPNERDRTILLSYMAAIVQRPGVKLQWWPVIQGVEGNGKSMIARIMKHAVGALYTHIPKASNLAESGMNFNDWMREKLLLIIEEIKVKASDRIDLLDALKDVVTNESLEMQAKGKDQLVKDNRANGLCFTNHKDGVPTGADKRRWCIFFTAQQTLQDKIDAGMTGGYFPALYRWFDDGGYAMVNHYLRTYAIPAWMEDTLMTEAPATSSTDEAFDLSKGSVEQEIQEAIDEGRHGFANGWINSFALDRLLNNSKGGSRIPPRKRRELLQKLGYDWHPALVGGRVSAPLLGDMGKARLFVKTGHIAYNLGLHQVAEAYNKSQVLASIPTMPGVEKGR